MVFLKCSYILLVLFIIKPEVLANSINESGTEYQDENDYSEPTDELKRDQSPHEHSNPFFDDHKGQGEGMVLEKTTNEKIPTLQRRPRKVNHNNKNTAQEEKEPNSNVSEKMNSTTQTNFASVSAQRSSNVLNATAITLIVLLVIVASLTVVFGCFYFSLTDTFQRWKKYGRRKYRKLLGRPISPYQREDNDRKESFRDRFMSTKIGRYGSQIFRGPPRNCPKSRPIVIEPPEFRALKERATAIIGLRCEFEDIKLLTSYPKATTQAQKSGNVNKNRYNNILPYDHSRVQLSIINGDKYSRYINASYIPGLSGAKEYIAAQGPLLCTVPDFWRMIWEQDVSLVVMLTQVEEHGRLKCAQYWPLDEQALTFASFTISLVKQTELTSYVIRDLEIERDGQKRTITQIQFTGWPDFGCPQNPDILLLFVEEVRRLISLQSNVAPTLVHCSAGVGRTGTFITIDCIMQEVREKSEIDVFGTVLKLRKDRMYLVQTEAQYRFVYQCLVHYCEKKLITSSELEENSEGINLV